MIITMNIKFKDCHSYQKSIFYNLGYVSRGEGMLERARAGPRLLMSIL
jgi:hypothetical protein